RAGGGLPCPPGGSCNQPFTPMTEVTGCFQWVFHTSFPKAIDWGVRFFVSYDPCACHNCNPQFLWDVSAELPWGSTLVGASMEIKVIGVRPQHIQRPEYNGCCDDMFCSQIDLKVILHFAPLPGVAKWQWIRPIANSIMTPLEGRIKCRFCISCVME